MKLSILLSVVLGLFIGQSALAQESRVFFNSWEPWWYAVPTSVGIVDIELPSGTRVTKTVTTLDLSFETSIGLIVDRDENLPLTKDGYHMKGKESITIKMTDTPRGLAEYERRMMSGILRVLIRQSVEMNGNFNLFIPKESWSTVSFTLGDPTKENGISASASHVEIRIGEHSVRLTQAWDALRTAISSNFSDFLPADFIAEDTRLREIMSELAKIGYDKWNSPREGPQAFNYYYRLNNKCKDLFIKK